MFKLYLRFRNKSGIRLFNWVVSRIRYTACLWRNNNRWGKKVLTKKVKRFLLYFVFAAITRKRIFNLNYITTLSTAICIPEAAILGKYPFFWGLRQEALVL